MAIWKVSAERAEIFPHPNSDRMDLCKVGMFQLVVAKSNGYQTGDVIVFAPSRAVLPPELRPHYTNSETGVSYLAGPERDRVSGIRLRGELSEGITIRLDYVLPKLGLQSAQDLQIGADIAPELGITKYEPPLPAGFGGEVRRLDLDVPFRHHDVEQFGIFGGEFVAGEAVLATEKIHGSQSNMLFRADGSVHLSSKGMASKGFEICEDQANIYWRALRNVRLPELVAQAYPGQTVQAFAEVYPAQGAAWSYGADGNRPLLRLFRLVVEGAEVPLHQVNPELRELWAPLLFEGPFDEASLRQLARGKEQVSGRELHIREGIVVTPSQPRPSKEGWNLALKIISDKFKGSDEDPS
jgi:RNA ligase (TIGR02306 family)